MNYTQKLESGTIRIAVVGLGYVGLPLAIELGKKYPTLGFDINQARVEDLNNHNDNTLEIETEEFRRASNLTFSANPQDLEGADVFIVTVPTPITTDKRPDLTPLIKASEIVGRALKPGNVVIYESTVYPGCCEEDCAPILEKYSGLSYASTESYQLKNDYFFLGYSPERINPGDKIHRLPNIKKVTSGSTPEIARFIDDLYGSIITAGTHLASSIKVAEAAKVIENTQRDINIGLVNELAIIFSKIGIDTEEVLQAAGTKWNFLPFRPGLVGGHCIGVDPYYLTYKAEQLGHRPELILSGRRLNDNMGEFVASTLIKAMIHKGIQIANAKILVMGLTFKENCPDIRNTKVIDIISELKDYNANVDIYDPQVSAEDAERTYGLKLITANCSLPTNTYDAIILAVAHKEFEQMGVDSIRSFGKTEHILYDLKYLLPKGQSDIRL